VTEYSKHPPRSRRRKDPFSVIDHHFGISANTECSHLLGKDRPSRQHVGARVGFVRNGINVKKMGTGDVTGEVLSARVTAIGGQIPRRIKHDQVLI
jgi:hypothetical protein